MRFIGTFFNHIIFRLPATNSLQAHLGLTDIYLIDQIMKGRYSLTDRILDAGCGNGRNIHWFLHEGYDIFGIDSNENSIESLKKNYPQIPPGQVTVSSIEALDFPDQYFNHIICSAVLHFATSTSHFYSMTDQLFRLIRPGGTLFIRMASDIGIEKRVIPAGDGVYQIPDGSTRFLLTRQLLKNFFTRYSLKFTEPFKTVNVDDQRCMSTLILTR